MTTQIVLNGAQNGIEADGHVKAPAISLPDFYIRPVDKKVVPLSKEATESGTLPGPGHVSTPSTIPVPPSQATKPLPPQAGVLTLLEGRTFVGKGYNVIFRPRSNKPLPNEPAVAASPPPFNSNVLELNLTSETQTFSSSLGSVPNRGFRDQEDIMLFGIPYVQSIKSLENPVTGLDDRNPATDIHFEPGLWMAVPATSFSPNEGSTLCRMASIPHGTTINAQGNAPNVTKPKPGKPTEKDIPPIDITPFTTGNPSARIPGFTGQKFDSKTDRIPQNLAAFKQTGKITPEILANPNQVLLNAIAKQDIESFVEFHVSTTANDKASLVGGGTANIGFLGGTGATATAAGTNANAHAVSMSATYWIEKVKASLQILPEQVKNSELNIKVMTAAGIDGPVFVVPKTPGLTHPVSVNVTWTQIQYSQTVLLDFEGLSWPHVSVGTLGDTSRIPVRL